MIKQNETELSLEIEFELEKVKFLKNLYPDLKRNWKTFSSKKVVLDHDNVYIYRDGGSLLMGATKTIEFSFKDKKESITIYSIPKANLILRQGYKYTESYSKRVRVIKFTKFFNKKFGKTTMDLVRKKILNYLREPGNENAVIDYSNMDVKVKKMLNFS